MYENKSFFMIPNVMIILITCLNLVLRSSPESFHFVKLHAF
jgi:hypothetical protein